MRKIENLLIVIGLLQAIFVIISIIGIIRICFCSNPVITSSALIFFTIIVIVDSVIKSHQY